MRDTRKRPLALYSPRSWKFLGGTLPRRSQMCGQIWGFSDNPTNLKPRAQRQQAAEGIEGSVAPSLCFITYFHFERTVKMASSDPGEVLLWPATQGIFKSGNMSARRKVRHTWLYSKAGDEAVKCQAMNWMLPCTPGLQTGDKVTVYLFSLHTGKCRVGLDTGPSSRS